MLPLIGWAHTQNDPWVSFPGSQVTLMYKIVQHTNIDEHLGKISEDLIVEHLFYTISIATNKRTPGIFFPLC